MDLLERDYYIKLFETYQELLTEKQKEYFISYYFDDLSLAEIASLYNVSRNAVFDQLKKIVSNLCDYEEKLKILVKKKDLFEFSLKLDESLKQELQTIIEE